MWKNKFLNDREINFYYFRKEEGENDIDMEVWEERLR